MRQDKNLKALLVLLRVGLFPAHDEWSMVLGQTEGQSRENDPLFHDVDWEKVYQFAEEQSVQGLVLQGFERVRSSNENLGIPQMLLLQWIGEMQIVEQRNKEMNDFVAKLLKRLRKGNVFSLLVKGQGVAQCYEEPLWRLSGDVDLLLDDENYEEAKKELIPIAYDVEPEDVWKKHFAFKIMGVDVELHGRMPFGISHRADDVIDEVLEDSLRKGGVSKWSDDDTEIYVPNSDNHTFIVFTHFLRHFFIEGVGLRQICDWCRMLYTYRESLNGGLLEMRLTRSGLMSEWKAFASLAVDYLGMPVDAMPFYDERFKRKGEKVLELVIKAGSFGYNKDLSYRVKYKGCTYKIVSFWRRFWDFLELATIFPIDAPKFFVTYLTSKAKY